MAIEGVDIPKHIRELMDRLSVNQTQLGAAVETAQSIVSRWLSDTDPARPSVEALIRLGALAATADPAEAAFFWEQTGIDASVLAPLAQAALKLRMGDQKELQEQGKIVLVPPYGRGEWAHRASLDPIALSAGLVENPASTFYIVADPNRDGFGHRDGETIVFDVSGAPTRKVSPFVGRYVLMDFQGAGKRMLQSAEPWGLVTGKVRVFHNSQRVRFVTLFRFGAHVGQNPYLGLPEGTDIRLGAFTPGAEVKFPPEHYGRPRWANRPYTGVVLPGTFEEALAAFTLPEGFQIMGRLIAIFPGEGAGKGKP